MKCPFCSHTKSKVTDKRGSVESVRRRRECLKCSKRFTTYEKIVESEIYVIKKDNSRQKFNTIKIEKGLERVFLKRPISHEKIKKIASDIEEQLRRKGKKEVKSKVIGEMMMRKIKRLDKVAFIRFASVYNEFKDLDDFKEQLEELE